MSHNQPEKYPKQWSTVVVHYRDGTSSEINMSAGIGIAKHLIEELHHYRFCVIRNDSESVIFAADLVAKIEMRQITKEETT